MLPALLRKEISKCTGNTKAIFRTCLSRELKNEFHSAISRSKANSITEFGFSTPPIVREIFGIQGRNSTIFPRYMSVVPSSSPSSDTDEQHKEAHEGSEPVQKGRAIRSGPVTWGSLALLILTGAGIIYYYDSEKKKKMDEVRQARSAGKAAIGGPFSLLDQNGQPITDQDLKGSWNLIYFGFTYCPDICPEELEKMAASVDILEKKSGTQIRPVFISIDAERDTVPQVKEYVAEFHPRLLGLTGTVESTAAAARQYRVYYMKTNEEGDDYLVDHSIIMYLMDPNMEFVKFFGKNYSAESLAEGIAEEIKNWKK